MLLPILPKYFPNFIRSRGSTPINLLTKPGKIEPYLAALTCGALAAGAAIEPESLINSFSNPIAL